MTTLNAPTSWSWRGKLLGTRLDYDHRVEPHGHHGKRITFAIDGCGATVHVIGPLFAAVYGPCSTAPSRTSSRNSTRCRRGYSAAFSVHRPVGGPMPGWFHLGAGLLLLGMDFALTFVTPALAYTTRSALRAMGIGFAMIRQTWPRSALYVLCPPLALNLLHMIHPISGRTVGLAISAVLVIVSLLAKGAIAAFYLRERGSYSDDGAAYITAQDEPAEVLAGAAVDRP